MSFSQSILRSLLEHTGGLGKNSSRYTHSSPESYPTGLSGRDDLHHTPIYKLLTETSPPFFCFEVKNHKRYEDGTDEVLRLYYRNSDLNPSLHICQPSPKGYIRSGSGDHNVRKE